MWSRVAQWKRAGPITQRSEDRNLALLDILRQYFKCNYYVFRELNRHKHVFNYICMFDCLKASSSVIDWTDLEQYNIPFFIFHHVCYKWFYWFYRNTSKKKGKKKEMKKEKRGKVWERKKGDCNKQEHVDKHWNLVNYCLNRP